MNLSNPRVESDSLSALVLGTGTVRIALTDVTSLEARHSSIVRTLLLGAVLLPFVVFGVVPTVCDSLQHYCR